MQTKTIKYTTDGKKVVVIGDLNQTEKIVQEIFVTEEGDEIPQGERFVVKNLLDSPAKSWKEKELENLELKYEKEKKYWEDRINEVTKETKKAYDSLQARVKWLRGVAKEPRDSEFKRVINLLADFLSDTEKWVFIKKYSEWFLVEFNPNGVDSILDRFDGYHGRCDFDEMRLLSLYGKTDGSLVFRINDYSDGSGSNKDVEFFKSKEEALVFMQKEFDNINKYEYYHLEIAKKYNLILDENKLELYNNQKIDKINKSISEYETKIEELKKGLLE